MKLTHLRKSLRRRRQLGERSFETLPQETFPPSEAEIQRSFASFEFATAVERRACFVSVKDVGKIAFQRDNDTLYTLVKAERSDEDGQESQGTWRVWKKVDAV